MMHAIQNQMRMLAQLSQNERMDDAKGVVVSYDPDSYAARVVLKPADVLTGWLPIAAEWVGNGWGMFCPPSIGDLVAVAFTAADSGSGTITGRIFNDEDRPLSVPSGELWLVHKSGQYLKLLNDGTIESHGAWLHKGSMVIEETLLVQNTITGQGGMAVTGDNGTGKSMSIDGNTDFTGQVTANGKPIDETHRHANVQFGNDQSGTVV